MLSTTLDDNHYQKSQDDYSRFSQTHNIGNNANIGIRGFNKMLPLVGTEPRPSDGNLGCLLWLWTPEEMSPEVQNNGPKNGQVSTKYLKHM